MSQPKVVALSTASNKTPKKSAPLPPILHTMRQHSRKQLGKLVEGLFNNVDDALFEMADRSRSDADQHLYFESMRELRLQRENIAKAFARTYSEGFDQAFLRNPEEEAEEPNYDELGMVENDQLEMSVAVAGITSKITSQYSLLIMQLTRRMDHMVEEAQISERSNPMGPERLGEAFVTALECAELDIKVRIILVKLFERFVMERLSSFYTEANQMLADAGVLPDLKNVMRREQRQTSSPKTNAPGAGERTRASGATGSGGGSGDGDAGFHATSSYAERAPSGGGEQGFGFIQELLAASRAAEPGSGSHAGLPRTGTPLSTTDVLSALGSAQQQLDASIDIDAVPEVMDLRQVVITHAPAGSGSNAHLAQADDDVVHFVGMLFDYILNDRNLAIPMKALIGRLQLPIVRLAIMDRSFFGKSGHPARQLLNELSSAGIGWSSTKELKRDALYNKVESVVLRVMNGFADDPGIFQELLDELRGFVRNDDKKRDQVEQRVRDNEKGRAKTINAKQAVQKLINQKASGMRLPAEVGRFVSDTWSKVLVYTCVKHGDRAPEWQYQAQTLDDLLWCLQPLDSADDLDRRDEMLPGLLQALKAGMIEIQLPDAEVEKRAADIESHLTSICANDRAYLEEDEPAPVDDSFEVMDEIILTLPGEQLDTPTDVDVEPAYIEQIGKLREGSWVELTQQSGELLRCKLSTIIEPGGRYIFVNRRGMKVAERSRRGLAIELKRKTLNILEESQVFDRALQAVIGNLRQMHRSGS